jgi:hypothetical protein
MALAANAFGPNQMQYAKSQSRALIAIYRNNDTAARGEFAITPFITGTQVYSWAVVSAGPCGEQVLAQGSQYVEVNAGTARLVVQNRFVAESPNRRIRSRAGTYEALIFDGRFEIRDVATNSLIISQSGTDVNFSPTGRFVAWKQSDGFYSIADLVSGTIVASDFNDSFLAWARQDSYVIAGGSGWGAVRIKNLLVDDSHILAANPGSHASDAWTDVQVVLDFDRGFVLAKASFTWKIRDLFLTIPSDDPGEGEAEDVNNALTYIRKTYDDNYPALPKIWSLGERLSLSHVSPYNRIQAKFLVESSLQTAATNAPASRSPDGWLVGRSVTNASAKAVEQIKDKTQSDLAFYSLGQFGIKTLSPAAQAHATQPYNSNREKIDEMGARLKAIGSRVSAAHSLFLDGAKCNLETDPNRSFYIDPAKVTDVWQWRGGDGDRWLILAKHAEGSGAFPQACAVLFRESSQQPVRLLDPEALGILSQGGQDIDLSVFRVTDSLIAIASRVTERINGIRLLDEFGNPVGKLIPILDSSLLAELRVTRDAKHLVQLNKDGRFFVYSVADAKSEIQGVYIDNEIVVMTNDGWYDTTYEGDESVQVRFAGLSGLFAVNQFEATLRRHGLAQDILENGAIPSAPPPLLTPPTVELILSARPNFSQRSGKVIADSGRDLSAIHVHLDGRLISTIPIHGQHAEVSIDVPDPGGARRMSAVAVDKQGLVSLPSSILLPGPVRPRGIARVIAIGVDAYTDPRIPNLASTKLDARHFAHAMASTQGHAFSSVQSTLLLDADVTRDKVLDVVKAEASKTTEDDTLVFFFAGHGVDGAQLGQPSAGLVLATNRTVMSDIAKTSVLWTDLASLFSVSKGTVIVVLDACQSGIAGREAFSTNDDVVSALFTKAGAPLIVLAASKGRQESEEVANGGGGKFTNAIVAAITNERGSYDSDHSGLIDLSELYSGVKTRVARETQGRQTPWLARNRLVGEISLF